MNRIIKFAKIEATGNDFICIKQDKDDPLRLNPSLVKRMCHRHLGIGADGLILLDRDENDPPFMHYYNADGLESTMCGNGLRAAVLFTHVMLENCRPPAVLKAGDGPHRVFYHSADRIRVEILTDGKRTEIETEKLDLPAKYKILGKVDTGVPHVVIDVGEELDRLDVSGIGKRLRNHLMFQPEGTNINFLRTLSNNSIEVRTYERGVEAETLSCGTGITASALLFKQISGNSATEMDVVTQGGRLKVRFEHDGIFLEGPAHFVFTGHYAVDE
ncbi:MAG TPA: diaminopimelate epimerase [Caldithrix abyssi]|uniref:Diaminopimelate epimerase n=1 Tax=Caldithrix abyssi TaxID=187145 RepID=A0A7V4WVM2_CALAY|nr:diaminopimelate epimerase [Caldithrix abyssi]